MSTADSITQLFLRLLRAGFDPDTTSENSVIDSTADWAGIVALAETNRTIPLLHSLLPADGVPAEIRAQFKQGSVAAFAKTRLRSSVLSRLADSFAGLPWAVLRGPVLGQYLYRDLMLRPFSDLDLLVMPEQVEEALQRLNAMGVVPMSGALSDQFYRTYHLHIQRVWKQGAAQSLLELHWAIDHPYSLFTPDVEGILQRAVPVRVSDVDVPMPETNDLLVLLCLHVVKHAVWLPVQVERECVSDVVEAGDLLGLLDVAWLVCGRKSELSWDIAAARAKDWGAGNVVRTCLDAIEQLWPGSVDAAVRQRFPDVQVTTRQQRQYERRDRQSRWLASVAGRGVFRPVRAMDLRHYLFPPGEYLQRRYGTSGIARRVAHTASGGCKMAANAIALARESRRRTGP